MRGWLRRQFALGPGFFWAQSFCIYTMQYGRSVWVAAQGATEAVIAEYGNAGGTDSFASTGDLWLLPARCGS